MARIPYADPQTLDAETRDMLGRLPPLNLFRMLAHAESALPRYVRMGNALLTKGSLDPVLREMAIVRVGHLCGAAYELHQHDRISRDLGMAEDKLAALAEGPDAAPFTELESAVLRFTDEVVRDVRPTDATFDALAGRLSHGELVELVLVTGYYMMTCRVLETLGVDIEAGDGAALDLDRR